MDIISLLMDEKLIQASAPPAMVKGRTDRFTLAKSGNIKCLPAECPVDFKEYSMDYGDEFKSKADSLINVHMPNIKSDKVRHLVEKNCRLKRAEDLYL